MPRMEVPEVVEVFDDGCAEVRFPDPVFHGSVVYYANADAAYADIAAGRELLVAGVPMEDVSEAAYIHSLMIGGQHA